MDFLPVLAFVAYVIFKIFKALAQTGEDDKAGEINRPWENDQPWENDETKKTGRPAILLQRTEKRIAPAIVNPENITRQDTLSRQDTLTRQNNDLTPDYREKAVTLSVPASLEEQTNPWLELLSGENLVQGMVLKEILQPSRALRPFSLQRR
ncbi:MAG: hypothetical protein WA118_02800 [Carboxydocellales bacterium]